MRIQLCAILLSIYGLASCASSPPVAPTPDPLARMFPIQANYAAGAAGFASVGESVAADPFEGRLIRFRASNDESITLSARIFVAGAFVSDQAAVDRVFDGARTTLGSQARLISERRLRVMAGSQLRLGRSGQFAVSEAGVPHELHLASYFVDPYAIVIQSIYPSARAGEISPSIEGFAQAWIPTVQADLSLLCGAPEMILVRNGLSNVSTNGRVIFLSTETDNVDDQTIAELSRASAQQRARVGCPAQADDFSAVEAAMRKRSRSR